MANTLGGLTREEFGKAIGESADRTIAGLWKSGTPVSNGYYWIWYGTPHESPIVAEWNDGWWATGSDDPELHGEWPKYLGPLFVPPVP